MRPETVASPFLLVDLVLNFSAGFLIESLRQNYLLVPNLRNARMNKFSTMLLLVLSFLAAALGFYAPFRQTVSAHFPVIVQNLLPSIKTNNSVDSASSSSGGKDRGGATAVSVASAKLSTLPLVERTYGVVKSPAVAAINARIASQITEVHVKDGQVVKAGDLLVTLDDRALQNQLAKDQAVLLKDKALEASLAADLSRAQDLVKKGAGTVQAYDQAVAAQKAAEATVGADQAAMDADQVQLDYTRISAPIGGRLGAVQAVVGNLAGTGSSGNLVTITQMMPLKVTFQLPENVLPDIRAALQTGQPVPVRVLQSGTAIELESGNLDFIDSTVDTTSGTIAMSATIDNDQLSLWPGQYVDVEVNRGELANAIIVPTVAVQQGQTGPFVWMVNDDNTVTARPVTVAHSENDKSAITSGLAAGDKVVVEGQLRLKDGTKVKMSSPPVAAGAAGTVATGGKTKSHDDI
jgi:multidrug efflux system membrane fusion protein